MTQSIQFNQSDQSINLIKSNQSTKSTESVNPVKSVRRINPAEAEIMAPVGSYESLRAALDSGCDSIYFGVTQLNMRSRAADNFTLEDLRKITSECHNAGVKAYLVVNTLLYDHDVAIMRKIIDTAKEESIDAIIVFDFAALLYCNQVGIPAHVSVQFSVSNYESLTFFSKWTNRVVLARELTLKQIKAIYERIVSEQLTGNEGRLMEIEAFVHGALCVAQSGRCFMSLHTHNASANRGACMQNCRAKYKVTDMDSGKELVIDNHYVMSAADICMIDSIDKLLEAGIKVFKIEGRGRSPEYVSTVVSVYKQALADVVAKNYTKERIEDYYKQLKTVFNRGLSHGNYYLGEEIGKEQGEYSNAYGSQSTEEKAHVGRVRHYFVKPGACEVELTSGALSKDDEVYIIGATTGVLRQKIGELRDYDENTISSSPKGTIVTFRTKDKQRVRKNDKVYVIKKRTHIE